MRHQLQQLGFQTVAFKQAEATLNNCCEQTHTRAHTGQGMLQAVVLIIR
jgi:hypothetical protein